ncbi:hypothetical protein Kisp01_36040 [Kineosporia sp. NBRC 101677]|nr:hypothetical protein Kisp01_36040 [Kineosporia sp. NBRC 101677]
MPLAPNAETPARRGAPPSASTEGHATGSVSSETSPADQSTCGVGASMCSVCGICWFCSASTILITPATPPAAWVCPMFDFTEPSRSGAVLRGSWPGDP